MLCRRYYISGKVQGVWFRASTKTKAKDLSLTGFAKNLSDGRVEVVACGDIHQLEALEAWLWQGPPKAEVSAVMVEEIASLENEDFIIL